MITKLYKSRSVTNSEPDKSPIHFEHLGDVPRHVSIAMVGVEKALRRFEEWKQNDRPQ